jgi:hypothetical protein
MAALVTIGFISFCSDNLNGTDVYGSYEANPTSDNTFSVPFSGLITSATDVLFMSGDRSQYLVMKYEGTKAHGAAMVLAASYSSSSLCVLQYWHLL